MQSKSDKKSTKCGHLIYSPRVKYGLHCADLLDDITWISLQTQAYTPLSMASESRFSRNSGSLDVVNAYAEFHENPTKI
jgi:hypothetical protein